MCIEVRSGEQLRDDLGSLKAYVVRDFAEDRIERSHPQFAVVRNGDMVFTTLLCREAHVTTCLAGDLVSIPLQPPGQIAPREISWYPHAAITSSRTKCRRIILGTSSSS